MAAESLLGLSVVIAAVQRLTALLTPLSKRFLRHDNSALGEKILERKTPAGVTRPIALHVPLIRILPKSDNASLFCLGKFILHLACQGIQH